MFCVEQMRIYLGSVVDMSSQLLPPNGVQEVVLLLRETQWAGSVHRKLILYTVCVWECIHGFTEGFLCCFFSVWRFSSYRLIESVDPSNTSFFFHSEKNRLVSLPAKSKTHQTRRKTSTFSSHNILAFYSASSGKRGLIFYVSHSRVLYFFCHFLLLQAQMHQSNCVAATANCGRSR